MIRRAGLFILIAFQALWLNVILPGHTRGVISLPDSSQNCCDVQPAKAKATPVKASNCAICYFAATLVTPPPILALPSLGFLTQADRFSPRQSVSIESIDVYFGRAPPASA